MVVELKIRSEKGDSLTYPAAWVTPSRKDWMNIPGRIVTKSLLACETGEWSLISYPRAKGGGADFSEPPSFAKFCCGSWRCRECGPKVRASDFIRVACASKANEDWFYLVLTVDPEEWGDRWQAFGGIYNLWQNRLRKKIERFAKAYEDTGERLKYIMTFERHTSSGWPHVNILISHPGLRSASDSYGTEIRRKGRSRDGRPCHKPNWRPILVDMVQSSGFGKVVWVEDIQDPTAWAGYITKLAHELVGAEVKSQTPYGAPKGFRRIRATRGTLPPTFAAIKRQSGISSDRVWSLTGKTSYGLWEKLDQSDMLKSAKIAFERTAKEGTSKPLWAPAIKLLGIMEQALKTEVPDWASLVAGWQELEDIKKWNKNLNARAKAEATQRDVNA